MELEISKYRKLLCEKQKESKSGIVYQLIIFEKESNI